MFFEIVEQRGMRLYPREGWLESAFWGKDCRSSPGTRAASLGGRTHCVSMQTVCQTCLKREDAACQSCACGYSIIPPSAIPPPLREISLYGRRTMALEDNSSPIERELAAPHRNTQCSGVSTGSVTYWTGDFRQDPYLIYASASSSIKWS